MRRTKSKRATSASKLPKGTNRKRSGYKRPPDLDIEGEWDYLDTYLRRDLQKSRNSTEKLAPFERPDAILKRQVYRFVRENLAKDNGKKLKELLEYLRAGEKRAHYKAFDENPFFWALSAIPTELSELTRPALTKIARQLLYAHHHEITPDLLIGFILQTGNPDAISKKASNSDTREDWYLIKINAN